jgi:hypothetical protein
MDLFDIIIDDYCTLDKYSKTATDDLYSVYIVLCVIKNHKPISKITFGKKLSQKGLKHTRVGHNGNRGYEGIRINY